MFKFPNLPNEINTLIDTKVTNLYHDDHQKALSQCLDRLQEGNITLNVPIKIEDGMTTANMISRYITR